MPQIMALLRRSGTTVTPPVGGGIGGGVPGFDPSDRVLSRQEMETLAAKYWPPEEVENAVNVSQCESEGFHTGAWNRHGEDSRGLWQINLNAWPQFASRNLFDPDTNAATAYYIWTVTSPKWNPWTCAHNLGIVGR